MKVTIYLERDPPKSGAWSTLNVRVSGPGVTLTHQIETGKGSTLGFDVSEENAGLVQVFVEPVT